MWSRPLVVTGHLDVAVGDVLVSEARSAALGARRVDIDLQGIDSFTADGAAALGTCRELGSDLDEGLHYRTGRDPAWRPCSKVVVPGGTDNGTS